MWPGTEISLNSKGQATIPGGPKPVILFCFEESLFNQRVCIVWLLGVWQWPGQWALLWDKRFPHSWSLYSSPFQMPCFVGVHVLSPGALKQQCLNSRLFALPHSNASSRKAGDFCLSLKALLWYWDTVNIKNHTHFKVSNLNKLP